MSDDNVSFKVDLDAKDAIANAQNLQKKISDLGDSDLSGLIKGFTELALPIAALGTAMFAVKKAFDLSLEGAQLERIDQQFNNLAESAGISGVALKEGIHNAIGPTNDLNDALAATNKAIVSLGPSLSQNIPQYFEIARKAARQFGGDINQRFSEITMAIESGNTRLLKHIGITIDANKAYASYAKSIGVTVEQLSQQGKQIAISNALQAQASDKYKNIDVNTKDLITSWESFKVTMKDVGESVAIAFDKMFGPAFSKALEYFNGLLKDVGTHLKANFGNDAEAAAAKVDLLNDKIAKTSETLVKAKDAGNMGEVESLTAALKNMNEELDKQLDIKAKLAKEKDLKEISSGKGPGTPESTDKDKDKQQAAAYQAELLKLTQSRLTEEMALETDANNYKNQLHQQEALLAQQYEAKQAQISADAGEGKKYNAEQAKILIETLEEEKTAKLAALQEDEKNTVMKVYEQKLKYAKTYSDAVKALGQQEAAQAHKDLDDKGKQSKVAFDALNKNSSAAFIAMGKGSKTASEAMKDAMIGTLADIAEAQGNLHLTAGLANIFAGNAGGAGEAAEGAALLALSGLLRSQAGSSSGSSGGGGGAVSGGASIPSVGGDIGSTKPDSTNPTAQKTVTIQVQGNYFETEQTKNAMVDLIRQATDATAFKYQQIGVS